jgi:hypothetical protein
VDSRLEKANSRLLSPITPRLRDDFTSRRAKTHKTRVEFPPGAEPVFSEKKGFAARIRAASSSPKPTGGIHFIMLEMRWQITILCSALSPFRPRKRIKNEAEEGEKAKFHSACVSAGATSEKIFFVVSFHSKAIKVRPSGMFGSSPVPSSLSRLVHLTAFSRWSRFAFFFSRSSNNEH